MGGKAEPATALKSAAERRSSPAPPRRQFDHVTSFLKGWALAGVAHRAAHQGTRVAAPAGRRTVKTEPLPGSLVTVTSPPIMRASLRVMARPRPVPPKR